MLTVVRRRVTAGACASPRRLDVPGRGSVSVRRMSPRSAFSWSLRARPTSGQLGWGMDDAVTHTRWQGPSSLQRRVSARVARPANLLTRLRAQALCGGRRTLEQPNTRRPPPAKQRARGLGPAGRRQGTGQSLHSRVNCCSFPAPRDDTRVRTARRHVQGTARCLCVCRCRCSCVGCAAVCSRPCSSFAFSSPFPELASKSLRRWH